MDTIGRHLIIRGRVQGVGFRHFMLRTAQELRITGWVCNRADGSVEAVVAGPPDAVHMMLERARRGPLHALVTDVAVTEAHGHFERFDVR